MVAERSNGGSEVARLVFAAWALLNLSESAAALHNFSVAALGLSVALGLSAALLNLSAALLNLSIALLNLCAEGRVRREGGLGLEGAGVPLFSAAHCCSNRDSSAAAAAAEWSATALYC